MPLYVRDSRATTSADKSRRFCCTVVQHHQHVVSLTKLLSYVARVLHCDPILLSQSVAHAELFSAAATVANGSVSEG
jgi:hypothetical protein